MVSLEECIESSFARPDVGIQITVSSTNRKCSVHLDVLCLLIDKGDLICEYLLVLSRKITCINDEEGSPAIFCERQTQLYRKFLD